MMNTSFLQLEMLFNYFTAYSSVLSNHDSKKKAAPE